MECDLVSGQSTKSAGLFEDGWDVRVCMQLTDDVDSFLSTVVEDSFIRKMHTLFALQRERSSPGRGA